MAEKKILVIDDDDELIGIYKVFCSYYEGINVIHAVDGNMGFEIAKAEKPDLIILDNKMPVISGEKTAKLLKNESATRSIPIIMITGFELSNEEQDCVRIDVDELMKKPFSPKILKEKIEKYLGTLTKRDINTGEV